MTEPFQRDELGIQRLLERLGKQHPRYIDVLNFQARLQENIDLTRRDGDSETRRADRAQIRRELNLLSLGTLDMSFNDLFTASDSSGVSKSTNVSAIEPTFDPAPEVTTSEKAADSSGELQDLFIFLVEDSLISGKKLAGMLYKAGAVVVETELSAERAKRRLENSPYPDFVITNYKLLGSETGSDLADWMSKQSHLDNTLRVSYSTVSRQIILKGRNDELFHSIINRPIQTSDLLKKLMELWSQRITMANQRALELSENTINPGQLARNPSIIVVDRYSGILSMFIMYINRLSEIKRCDAVAFFSGLRALEFFTGRSVPLVITDCHIFGMDGWEFIANIKQRSPDTRIALCTGYLGSDTIERANKLGVDYYLWKPFSLDDLELILLDALR